jgi:hypothetical protein
VDNDGDGLLSDIDPDDSVPNVVYYYGTGSKAAGDMTGSGSWNGSSCTDATKSASPEFTLLAYAAMPSFPANKKDFVVEAQFRLVSTLPSPAPSNPRAGIIFRINSISGNTDHSGMACVVDFTAGTNNKGELQLHQIYYGGSAPLTNTSVVKQVSFEAIPAPNKVYRIRAVSGSSGFSGDGSVTCFLVKPGGVNELQDVGYESGTVGFFANHVEVCFDYLWVIKK